MNEQQHGQAVLPANKLASPIVLHGFGDSIADNVGVPLTGKLVVGERVARQATVRCSGAVLVRGMVAGDTALDAGQQDRGHIIAFRPIPMTVCTGDGSIGLPVESVRAVIERAVDVPAPRGGRYAGRQRVCLHVGGSVVGA